MLNDTCDCQRRLAFRNPRWSCSGRPCAAGRAGPTEHKHFDDLSVFPQGESGAAPAPGLTPSGRFLDIRRLDAGASPFDIAIKEVLHDVRRTLGSHSELELPERDTHHL